MIGVGVKQSTSDLLIANCDEFIFYDDLVRESQRAAKRDTEEVQPEARRSPDEEKHRKEELEARKSRAIEIAVETFDALVSERGDSGKIWASALKQAIKRRKPDFNESYFGFRAFGNLLDEAQLRGLLELGRDEKSGTYVYRSNGGTVPGKAVTEPAPDVPVAEVVVEAKADATTPTPAGGCGDPRQAGGGSQETWRAANRWKKRQKPERRRRLAGLFCPKQPMCLMDLIWLLPRQGPVSTASLAGPDSTASSARARCSRCACVRCSADSTNGYRASGSSHA